MRSAAATASEKQTPEQTPDEKTAATAATATAATATAYAAQADMIRDLVSVDEVRAMIERTR